MAKETKTHIKDGRAGFGLYAADVIVFDIFVQPDSKSLHYVWITDILEALYIPEAPRNKNNVPSTVDQPRGLKKSPNLSCKTLVYNVMVSAYTTCISFSTKFILYHSSLILFSMFNLKYIHLLFYIAASFTNIQEL